MEYDRTSEKRTKVIDDESDYFSVDAYKWMTSEQKIKLKEREKELREKRHGSRLDRKIDFDFAGNILKEFSICIYDFKFHQKFLVMHIIIRP